MYLLWRKECLVKELLNLTNKVWLGLGAAWKVADVSKGSTVAIFGLGTVGLSVSLDCHSIFMLFL